MFGERDFLRRRRAFEQSLQTGVIEAPTSKEGVDGDRLVLPSRRVHPDEEVPREAHATRPYSHAPGDFAIDEREGDGDPEPAVENIGQQAVLGVVVILLVPTEAELFVQIKRQRTRLIGGGKRREVAGSQRCRHVVEAGDRSVDVERRVGVACDERRTDRDVDALVGERSELFEGGRPPEGRGLIGERYAERP